MWPKPVWCQLAANLDLDHEQSIDAWETIRRYRLPDGFSKCRKGEVGSRTRGIPRNKTEHEERLGKAAAKFGEEAGTVRQGFNGWSLDPTWPHAASVGTLDRLRIQISSISDAIRRNTAKKCSVQRWMVPTSDVPM
jgi:hypothetical protein